MSFFEDNLCQNKKSGGIIESDLLWAWARPSRNAFDGDLNAQWLLPSDEYDGKFWIGLDFGIPTEIGCVVLTQGFLFRSSSSSVVVEGTRDSLPTQNWFPVNNMLPVSSSGVTNTIVLS